MRVMRAWRGLGVELHAQDRFMLESQPFQRIIVQTFVSNFNFIRIQITSSHTIIMVLRGDENFTRWQMLNGMIPAMMSKLEAVCLRSQCASDQLVSKTDSENWHIAFDQFPDCLHRVR